MDWRPGAKRERDWEIWVSKAHGGFCANARGLGRGHEEGQGLLSFHARGGLIRLGWRSSFSCAQPWEAAPRALLCAVALKRDLHSSHQALVQVPSEALSMACAEKPGLREG